MVQIHEEELDSLVSEDGKRRIEKAQHRKRLL
jgi:hypothetical protein